MKRKDEIYQGLYDADSSYFAGSACFLSLVPILECLEKDMIYFKDAFGGIYELIDRLIEEDGRYFSLSLEKGKLSDEKWKDILIITQDYAVFLDMLNEMLSVLPEAGLGRYVPYLKDKFIFLSHLCQSSLSSFYEMEDIPEEFFPIANACLSAIRG